jgi:hypothetical protein
MKEKQKHKYTGERLSPVRAYGIRALVEAGVSQREIARKEHVSTNTVQAIKYSDRFDANRVEAIKKNLSASWYTTAGRSLERITDQKLDQSSAAQLAVISAVATDKARLIEGKATSRTEYADKSDLEIQAEIKKLEDELGAIETEGAVDAELSP